VIASDGCGEEISPGGGGLGGRPSGPSAAGHLCLTALTPHTAASPCTPGLPFPSPLPGRTATTGPARAVREEIHKYRQKPIPVGKRAEHFTLLPGFLHCTGWRPPARTHCTCLHTALPARHTAHCTACTGWVISGEATALRRRAGGGGGGGPTQVPGGHLHLLSFSCLHTAHCHHSASPAPLRRTHHTSLWRWEWHAPHHCTLLPPLPAAPLPLHTCLEHFCTCLFTLCTGRSRRWETCHTAHWGRMGGALPLYHTSHCLCKTL